MNISRWRALVAAVAVVAALAGTAVVASPAQAYQHWWNCPTAYSAGQCYDYSGTYYNPWEHITINVSNTSNHVCAKGVTAAGNIRSSVCAVNTTTDGTCYTSASPETLAYGYWLDTYTGSRSISGTANTIGC